MASEKPSAAQRCMGLPWQAVLQMYVEMLRDAPDATPVVGRVLRDKARAGEMPDEVIPLLVCCVVDTSNPHALVQLAKTLAVFGHKASMASSYLADATRKLAVTSDETFWALDGCLHSLSFLGGEPAQALIAEWAAAAATPVLKSRKVYQGVISEADRKRIFEETLADCAGRLEKGNGRGWRRKLTEQGAVEARPAKKTAPWMTR